MGRGRMLGPGFLQVFNLVSIYRQPYMKPLQVMFSAFCDYFTISPLRPDVVVCHPESVEYVLKANQKNYIKSKNIQQLRPMLGNGLLTSEGEPWKEHRRLIGPEFQHKKLA